MTQNDFYLGIDPGKRGGLARIGFTVQASKMPESEEGLWNWLSAFHGRSFAVIETINPAIGIKRLGGKAAGKAQMSKLYGSYRALLMALAIAKITTLRVRTSHVWRAYGIPPRMQSETDSQWKGRIKAKAQQLFPNLKVTLATADALLFAEYGRRREEGLLVSKSTPRSIVIGDSL